MFIPSAQTTAQRRLPRALPLALLLLLSVILLPVHAAGDHDSWAMTATMQVHVADANTAEIELARLTTAPNGQGTTALRLAWKKDTSGPFPMWKLYASGDLLPADTQQTELVAYGPLPDRTYEVNISYSPVHQTLATKVHDVTDGRILHAGSLSVLPYEGPLYAPAGRTQPYYIPISTVWTTGITDEKNQHRAQRAYTSREEKAVLTVSTPAAVPGRYEVYAVFGGTADHLTSIIPTPQPTRIALPLADWPLGAITLRLDYVENGRVLATETKQITIGYLDTWLDRLEPEPADGTVYTYINVRSPEPLAESANVSVTAALHQLLWDDNSRNFNYRAAYETIVYEGPIDLTTGQTRLPLALPMPEEPGNWQVAVTVEAATGIPAQAAEQQQYFSSHAPAQIKPGDPYTIIVFPDTQYFAQNYPWIYTRLTDWVTANAEEQNIAAVWHVGDITNNDTPPQWINAYASQSLLHGVVPYALTLGNHDMTNGKGGRVSKRGLTLINDYFTADEARRYSNLIGTMVPDRLENHYYEFNIGSDDYIVIALEFGPPNEAIAWANGIAGKYPNHRLVLLTHSYTAKSGNRSRSPHNYDLAENRNTTVNSAPDMWSKFVRRHTNSFMVISGHTSPPLTVAHNIGLIAPDQAVYELLFDYQNQDNGGNGWVGVLTFLPDDTVKVGIYSPYLDAWANEIDSYGYTSHNIIDLKSKRVHRIAP